MPRPVFVSIGLPAPKRQRLKFLCSTTEPTEPSSAPGATSRSRLNCFLNCHSKHRLPLPSTRRANVDERCFDAFARSLAHGSSRGALDSASGARAVRRPHGARHRRDVDSAPLRRVLEFRADPFWPRLERRLLSSQRSRRSFHCPTGLPDRGPAIGGIRHEFESIAGDVDVPFTGGRLVVRTSLQFVRPIPELRRRSGYSSITWIARHAVARGRGRIERSGHVVGHLWFPQFPQMGEVADWAVRPIDP